MALRCALVRLWLALYSADATASLLVEQLLAEPES
jgi:hypothetical protein